MTSRELVYQTLEFKNPPRAPRDLWVLPWANIYHGEKVKELCSLYPSDMSGVPNGLREYPPVSGRQYEIGEYVDEWGCRFVGRQQGVHGEVKEPIITDEDWNDAEKIRFPREWLTVDIDTVNRFCGSSDKFVSGGVCPRPFEQMQFMRGSENFFVDLAIKPPKMMSFISLLHEFYCECMNLWAKTDVDYLNFMDDWGTQKSLLISPEMWREIYKPMYRDYINIAHSAGKKIFMHSDGYTLEIIPDLVELGLDALNTQIFCMDFEDLEKFAGKLTFWGEIDRQYLMCFASPDEVAEAVRQVKKHLWKNGGCIAQLEFGAGGKPENALKAYETWDELFRA